MKTSYSSDSGVSDREEDLEAPSTSYRINTRSQTANRKRKQVYDSSDEEYSIVKRRHSHNSNDSKRNFYHQSRIVWFSDSQSDESSSSSSSSSDERYGSRKTKKSKGKKKKSTPKKTKRKHSSKDSKKKSKVTKYWKNKICSKSEVDTSNSDSSRANSPVVQTSKLYRRSSVRSTSPESNTRNMQEHNYSVPYTTDELKKFASGSRPRLRSVVTVKTEDSQHSSSAYGYTSHENSRLSDVGGSSRRSDSDDDYVSSRHRTNNYSPPRTSQKYELDHSMSAHSGTSCIESCPCKYTCPANSHVPRSIFYNGGSSTSYKRAHHGGNSKYPLKKRRRDS